MASAFINMRHPRAIGGAGDAVKKKAVLAGTGDDAPAPKNNALAIDTEAAELLRGSVATDAVLPEDGLNVAGEVDFGGRLRGHNRGKRYRNAKGEERLVHRSVPFIDRGGSESEL